MSYARFHSGSDVYVYLHVNGFLECCGCKLNGGYSCKPFTTTKELLAHLSAHRMAGDKVPDHTFEDLKADAEENDVWIKARMKQNGGTRDAS